MTLFLHHYQPLEQLHTFAIKVRARYFCELSSLTELPALLGSPFYKTGPVLWLGGGSNLLFTRDYPGLVVKLGLKGIHLLEKNGEEIIVEAAAGENWHDFVLHTLRHGWYGLENLSLIPGTVGASPIQNIGAYGVEVKDLIHQVICADLRKNGTELRLSAEECRFGYRDSIFKHKAAEHLLITAVHFRLSCALRLSTSYGDIKQELQATGVISPTPHNVSDAVIRIRCSKLPNPAELGNAGSFFKNPVLPARQAQSLLARHPSLPHYSAEKGKIKLSAGWLIDQCGLKGYRDGDAGVHTHQALVLVNYGDASGEQICALANKVCAKVRKRFGVTLEPEPLVL